MEFKKLLKNFQIGAAMSALQTEGQGTTKIGKLAFDKFFEEKPNLFFDGVGPNLTIDIMRHYKNDISMFTEIGLDSIRTGFSWARLFPDGKTLNREAVEFYHNYIDEYKKNNIKLYMTLFHFDMPQWAQGLGAWSSREVINAFVKYAVFCFKEYGDKVDYFVTFNEPLVPVFAGYLDFRHPPTIDNPKLAIEQAFGIFLAHAKVIKEYKKLNILKPIGVVFDWNYTYSFTNSLEDQECAEIYDAYVNKGPLQIMYNGTINPILIKTLKDYNLIPNHSKEELTIIKEVKIDFMGINYYRPCRVKKQSNGKKRWVLDEMTLDIPSSAKMNHHRGWEIYPQALYDIGIAIKKDFNNISWYIAENGMGVENEDEFRDKTGIIQDDYRIEFITEHLTWLQKSMDEGSNCFGYHLWAAIDCWSFRNAFKNRYGLIEVNLQDQSRKFKKSAFWFREIIKNR